jgi:hypothetical protein
MADVSKTGLWVDSAGRLVESEPVEGRLIVAKGGLITPRVQALMRTLPAPVVAPAPEERTVDEGGETATVDPDDAEQATASTARETATAPTTKETAATARKRASVR